MLRGSCAEVRRCFRAPCKFHLAAFFPFCLLLLCFSWFPLLASSGDFAHANYLRPPHYYLHCLAPITSKISTRLPVRVWPPGLQQLRGGRKEVLEDDEENTADDLGLWEFPVDRQAGKRSTERKRPPVEDIENEIILEKESPKPSGAAVESESSEEILDEEELDRREEEEARRMTIEDVRRVEIPKQTVEIPRTTNKPWDEDLNFDEEDTRPMEEKRAIFNAWVDKQPPEKGEPQGKKSPLWDASIVKDDDGATSARHEEEDEEVQAPQEDLARSKEWAQMSPQEEHQNQQDSALVAACEEGDVEAVAAAVDRGANVNSPNFIYSPLCIAVAQGSCELVHALAELGADVENMGARKSVERGGPEEEHRRGEDAGGAEDKAAEYDDDDERVRHAVSSPAYGRADCTPLQLATKEGRPEMVQLLLHLGADVNRRDSLGSTALHVAAREGRVSCISALVEGGADINAQNSLGRTALHDAVFANRARAIKKLLSLGADVTKEDDDGCSPNMIARRFRKAQSAGDLVQLLRAQSALPAALAKPVTDTHPSDKTSGLGAQTAEEDRDDMDDTGYSSSEDGAGERDSESDPDSDESGSSQFVDSGSERAPSSEDASETDAGNATPRNRRGRPDLDNSSDRRHSAGKSSDRWSKLGRLGASDGQQVLL